jgi:hypothetical protein
MDAKSSINQSENRTRASILTRGAGKVACMLVLCSLFCIGSVHGATYSLSIPAVSPWTDTGINLFAGQEILITASGSVIAGSAPGSDVDPNGVGPTHDGTRVVNDTVLPQTVSLTLIGKVGGTTAIGDGTPLPEGLSGKGVGFIGSSYDRIVPISGRLFLGFNDDVFGDNSGSFSVSLSVVPEPSTLALLGLGSLALVGRGRLFRRKV